MRVVMGRDDSRGILRRVASLLVALLLLAPVTVRVAQGCPFCTQQGPTLGEQYALAQVVAVVSWQKSTPAEGDDPGSTTFEVLELLKDDGQGPEKKAQITIPIVRPGPKGTLELWFASTTSGKLDWVFRTPGSPEAVKYLKSSPPRDTPTAQRLEFYAGYLQHPTEAIAEDAFGEFAGAQFQDVQKAKGGFDRLKLREWLTDEGVPASRRGLYGMMLGLAGNASDREFLKQFIEPSTDEVRIGIEGAMGGYLYLAGEPGVDFLEQAKIADPQTPFHETYAAVQALRFIWSYGAEQVPHERVLKTMRTLIDRPALCDIVINDLARWKDWSLQDRILGLYGTKGFDIPSIRRAMIRYLIASSKDLPEGATEPPPHVIKGRELVEQLRKKDPKRVSEVERFFFLQ
ncbi:MAG: hypothetical protein ACK5HA_14555 [Planctomycetaceae bacterium]